MDNSNSIHADSVYENTADAIRRHGPRRHAALQPILSAGRIHGAKWFRQFLDDVGACELRDISTDRLEREAENLAGRCLVTHD